jgi:hypothetical protein
MSACRPAGGAPEAESAVSTERSLACVKAGAPLMKINALPSREKLARSRAISGTMTSGYRRLRTRTPRRDGRARARVPREGGRMRGVEHRGLSRVEGRSS